MAGNASSELACLGNDGLRRNPGADRREERLSGILLLFSPWIDRPEVLEIDGMWINGNETVAAIKGRTGSEIVTATHGTTASGVMQGGDIMKIVQGGFGDAPADVEIGR
jgi:hypothetical protein